MEQQAAGSAQTLMAEEAVVHRSPAEDAAAKEDEDQQESDVGVYQDSDLESDMDEAPTAIEGEAHTAPDAASAAAAAIGAPAVPSAAGSVSVRESDYRQLPSRSARRATGGPPSSSAPSWFPAQSLTAVSSRYLNR